MTDSHVAKGLHKCPVCLEVHDHNMEVLIHKRLQNIVTQNYGSLSGVVTDWGLCKEHDEAINKHNKTFAIEIDPAKSEGVESGSVALENAHRTGTIGELSERIVRNLGMEPKNGIVFAEKGMLQELQEHIDKEYENAKNAV